MLLLWCCLALAQAPSATVDEEPKPKWGGVVLPLVTFNSTDGLQLGLGGEIFEKSETGFGFSRKITFQTLFSATGGYQSHKLIYETRTGSRDVFAEVGFKLWTSLLYGGYGGEDVVVDKGPAEEGNGALSLYGTVGVSYPTPWAGVFYSQLFARYVRMRPEEGGLLEADAPTGSQGGFFADVTVGYLIEDVDRWPLPTEGWRLDADVRVGAGVMRGGPRFVPSAALHAEAMGWQPLGAHLVVAARVMLAESVGDRPFWEAEFVGGQKRAEVGYEKALMGYGRNRTRGDGAAAAMVELRPYLGRTDHPFFDVAAYLTVFAENGWLFSRSDLGPQMPTLGGGAVLVWQGGTILRPFVAFGWRSDGPDAPRKATPEFGLALVDPL